MNTFFDCRFNRRENTQEVTVLSQGLAAEDRIAVASSQLPAPRERLDEAPSTSGARHEFVLPPNRAGQAPKLRPGKRPASATIVRPITPAAPTPPPVPSTSGVRHEFVLPPNRAGQAPKLRPGKRPASATIVRPITPAAPTPPPVPVPLPQFILLNPVPTMMAAAAGGPSAAPLLAPTPVFPDAPEAPAPTAPVSVSRFTQRNRRRRAEEEASGAHRRKYVREVAYNKCSKCGKPKTKEFGHSRFGSATFCPSVSGGKSLEEWLVEQRQQKKPGQPPP